MKNISTQLLRTLFVLSLLATPATNSFAQLSLTFQVSTYSNHWNTSGNGTHDGWAKAIPADGNDPYSYWWFNCEDSLGALIQYYTDSGTTVGFTGTPYATVDSIYGLGVGNYYVMVIDSDGNYTWGYTAISYSLLSNQQQVPGIFQDWASSMLSNPDSLFPVLITHDAWGNIITSSTVADDGGTDLVVTKTNSGGRFIWKYTYYGSGSGTRNEATAIVAGDSGDVFAAGIGYNATTNFDYVLIKLDSAGNEQFVNTYNGNMNGPDVPTAIAWGWWNHKIYLTGTITDSTALDFCTIAYDEYTGHQDWVNVYDGTGWDDVAFAIAVPRVPMFGGSTTLDDAAEITVSGASEDISLISWSYTSISYYEDGSEASLTTTDGSANGFARATAVKMYNGSTYITGTTPDSVDNYNITTMMIGANDTVLWTADEDYQGLQDIGNDLLVDTSGNVYVCGQVQSTATGNDFCLIKYNPNGSRAWTQHFDGAGLDDIARKMTFDAFGDIVVTGESQTAEGHYDFLTISYRPDGALQWNIFYDSGCDEDAADSKPSGITADDAGGVYVSGSSWNCDSSAYENITIKYGANYFITPSDTEVSPKCMLFYPNLGQIVDSNDSLRNDDVFFYTFNEYPQLFFDTAGVSFTFAQSDSDTTGQIVVDSLERIDMSFADGNMKTKLYPSVVHDTDQIMNYFLSQCPAGVTNVKGAEKIVQKDVYDKIDVMYANNNAGMKFYIIMYPTAEASQVKLRFTGAQSVDVDSATGKLTVTGVLGSFEYLAPRVYQLNDTNGRVALGWSSHYSKLNATDVGFSSGSYDTGKPLVIECARGVPSTTQTNNGNLWWSMFYGGALPDECNDLTSDEDGNVYATGTTWSAFFPITAGVVYPNIALSSDAFVTKFKDVDVQDWSTFYGGNDGDRGFGIAVQPVTHEVYFVGGTWSSDFPHNNFTLPNGDHLGNNGMAGSDQDGFIVKLDNVGGSVLWANYIGGTNDELAWAIAIEGDYTYVVGYTGSDENMNFPIKSSGSTGAYNQSVHCDLGSAAAPYTGFIEKFHTDGTLKWGTYFGGYEGVIITDIGTVSNQVIIAGYTLKAAGTANYAYYTAGFPPVTGFDGFPHYIPTVGTPYNQTIYGGSTSDNFIAEFDSNDNLIWSTFLGGSGFEGRPVHVDVSAPPSGTTIFLTGSTTSNGTPFNITPLGSYSQNNQGGAIGLDAYVMKFIDRNLVWSTCFGGDGDECALNLTHDQYREYIIGRTESSTGSAVACTTSAGGFPLCDYSALNFYYEPLFETAQATGCNIYLAAFDYSTEDLLWSTYFAEGSNEHAGLTFAYATEGLYLGARSTNRDDTEYPIMRQPAPAWPQDVNAGGGFDAVFACFDIGTLIGIDEINPIDNSLQIFPNPVENTLLVHCNSQFKTCRINIINVLGQTVYSGKYNSKGINEPIAISIKNFTNGFYNLQLINDEKIYNAKFVIQR